MPMEILGFEIQRKHVREKHHQCFRNVLDCFFRKIRRSRERRFLQHGSYLIARWVVHLQTSSLVWGAISRWIHYKFFSVLPSQLNGSLAFQAFGLRLRKAFREIAVIRPRGISFDDYQLPPADRGAREFMHAAQFYFGRPGRSEA